MSNFTTRITITLLLNVIRTRRKVQPVNYSPIFSSAVVNMFLSAIYISVFEFVSPRISSWFLVNIILHTNLEIFDERPIFCRRYNVPWIVVPAQKFPMTRLLQVSHNSSLKFPVPSSETLVCGSFEWFNSATHLHETHQICNVVLIPLTGFLWNISLSLHSGHSYLLSPKNCAHEFNHFQFDSFEYQFIKKYLRTFYYISVQFHRWTLDTYEAMGKSAVTGVSLNSRT